MLRSHRGSRSLDRSAAWNVRRGRTRQSADCFVRRGKAPCSEGEVDQPVKQCVAHDGRPLRVTQMPQLVKFVESNDRRRREHKEPNGLSFIQHVGNEEWRQNCEWKDTPRDQNQYG